MAAFNRDAALERQQIHEISLNVARRLLKVLERSRAAPPHIGADIEASARLIADIQREIDQLMAALPPRELMDIAVLTHILGSHRRALDLLEVVEQKASGLLPRMDAAPDAAQAHAALLATSREIEQSAFRQEMPGLAAPRGPVAYLPAPATAPYPQQHAPIPPAPQWAQPVGQRPPPSAQRAPMPPKGPAKKADKARSAGAVAASSVAAMRALVDKNPTSAAALAALTVVAGLSIAILSIVSPGIGDGTRSHAAATLEPGKKLDGRLATAGETSTEEAPAPRASGAMSAEAAVLSPSVGNETQGPIVVSPNMEQPYLVVLSTRRSTEELQQDYRGFKSAYPQILGDAKARVDRVQGQDRETWYRLSLIPPHSRADAKDLCRSLKAAGLTGCWIKPLPLGRQ